MLRRLLILAVFIVACQPPASAQDAAREFTLSVAPELDESGLIAHLLPRFALKTQRRAAIGNDGADATLGPGAGGTAVFARNGTVYRLRLHGANDAAKRFADWLGSEAGRQTVAAFAPTSGSAFLPAAQGAGAAETDFEGDPVLGRQVAEAHCGRCHRIAPDLRDMTLGSTPSFAAVRALPDWSERLGAFYALNPHPAFMLVEGVSPPFDPARPPPIVPVTLGLDEVAAVQAYVATLPAADLGAEVESR